MHPKTLLACFLALFAALLPAAATAQITTSLLSWENEPGGWQYGSGSEDINGSIALSSTGRYAAFVTDSRNLFDDSSAPITLAIVLRDNETGEITPVTVGLGGEAPNESSFAPTVSTDGRYVCFCSGASNLVAGDTNDHMDVFVRDMQTQTTRRVNVPYDGIWDQNEKTYCLTHAMSDDGRYVVFTTASSHMVPNDNNDSDDVFMRDTVANTTTLVSVSTVGGPGNESSIEPRIARNGRYVAFMSMASNLVSGTTTPGIRAYVRDTNPASLKTTLIGDGGLPYISATGRYVAWTGLSMTGDFAQTYLYDMQTTAKTTVSVAPDGTTLGNRDSMAVGVSDDGRYVCFVSKARNLVAGDTNDEADVFVRNLSLVPAATSRVSLAKDHLQGNRASGYADMSADGRFIAFASASEDLVAIDINEEWDVFLRGPMFAVGFTLADAANAIRFASGNTAATPGDMAKDVVQTAPSTGRLDIMDAVKIARSAAGLN